MNNKEKLINEIEVAPDYLVEKVLDFLLINKNSKQAKPQPEKALEIQLEEMAKDPEIMSEIASMNEEFLVTEMDGLT